MSQPLPQRDLTTAGTLPVACSWLRHHAEHTGCMLMVRHRIGVVPAPAKGFSCSTHVPQQSVLGWEKTTSLIPNTGCHAQSMPLPEGTAQERSAKAPHPTRRPCARHATACGIRLVRADPGLVPGGSVNKVMPLQPLPQRDCFVQSWNLPPKYRAQSARTSQALP